MITKQKGYTEKYKIFDVECDECGETLNLEVEGWKELIRSIKENEWKITKEGDDWKHYCKECK